MSCRVTVFIVYNAYPAKGKQKTWEKRVVCISWVMGCYKTMKQKTDGRYGQLLAAPTAAASAARLILSRLVCVGL